jgi:hypothetical protein
VTVDVVAKHAAPPFGLSLTTTITLCASLFAWAHFRTTKSAIKAHTLLDLRGTIPVFVCITHADAADSPQLDSLPLRAHDTVVLDRGYIDFARLYGLNQRKVRLVVRARKSLRYTRITNYPVDASTGLRADELVHLAKDACLAHQKMRSKPSGGRQSAFI